MPRHHKLWWTALIGLILSSNASLALSSGTGMPADLDRLRGPLHHDLLPKWQKAAGQARHDRLNPPNESWKNIWMALDRGVSTESTRAPLNEATNPRNASEMFAASTWLRWRILAQNADGRYSYAYAFNLSRMRTPSGNLHHEAAIFLFHARLVLAIDGSRCADWSSPQNVIAAYERQPQLRPLQAIVAGMTRKQRAMAMFEAIAIEEMRGERPPLTWLCRHGTQTQGALAAVGNPADVRGGRRDDNEGRGRDSSRDSDPITDPDGRIENGGVSAEPELVDARQWEKARRDLLDLNLQRVLDAWDKG